MAAHRADGADTERVTGIRVDDREALIAAGHSIPDLLQNAAASFFNQVFRDGFFHADLHPGNVFVDAKGALTVVDFGIMGRLDRTTRYYPRGHADRVSDR